MLKKTALLLICCYLFSCTELSQFLKLPMLIDHYVKHKREQNDLSLGEFLSRHYFNGDARDRDYDKDMKLPFKTCTFQGQGEMGFRIEIGQYLVPRDPGREFLHAKLAYYQFYETTALKGAVWQPPKTA